MNLASPLSGQAKSIFRSKTFWSASLGLAVAVAPFGQDMLQNGVNANNVSGLMTALFAYGATISSRVAANQPIYTPNGLPGPNQTDFAQPSS